MKQVVDFEQAVKLHELGIKVKQATYLGYNLEEEFKDEHNPLCGDEFLIGEFAPAMSIGELIEWVCEKQGYDMNQIYYLDDELLYYLDKYYTEPIDALVELAIKIKESE